MKILHLIDNITPINFGIWNVVLSTIPFLEYQGVHSTIAFPFTADPVPQEFHGVEYTSVKSRSMEVLEKFDPHHTMVVSHGNWKEPTRWGVYLSRKGFRWVSYPHGMLEPWSMQHKKWKKKIYFNLMERPMLEKADGIIAVGQPEYENLKKSFGNTIYHIPNGIKPYKGAIEKSKGKKIFLFLGRLHEKKGVLPLVKAWLESPYFKSNEAELWIAGPDEGELIKIISLFKERETEIREENEITYKNQNIKILGPLYGEQKEEVLRKAHFFVLPSQSEGFPTSILEAMTFGCIPIITKECNFPEALENNAAFQVDFNEGSIKNMLEKVVDLDTVERQILSQKVKEFADVTYSLEKIASKQYNLFKNLLNS